MDVDKFVSDRIKAASTSGRIVPLAGKGVGMSSGRAKLSIR